MRDYYLHAAGYPTRFAVVDVGLRCFSECEFCYNVWLNDSEDKFDGMKKIKFRTKEHIFKLLDSIKESGHCGTDFTGGEPTVHPDIVDIIRHATGIGLATRIITLSQYLLRPMRKSSRNLLDDLLAAGLTNFLLSVHAVDEELFKNITGGSWEKVQAVMRALDEKDFHYCSNTTVYEKNYKQLPAIAKEIIKHNIYVHNFICYNAYYSWGKEGRAGPVQARYKDIYPYMREAVEILDSAGVGVNIRYAPQCSMAGLEKHLVGVSTVRLDPQEWGNMIEHMPKGDDYGDPVRQGMRIPMDAKQPAPGARLYPARGEIGGREIVAVRGTPDSIAKVFPKTPCGDCKAIPTCDGIDGRYAERNGVDEFAAYGYSRGPLLDGQRVGYRAPFFVKLKSEAKMKEVVRRSIKPEPLKDNPLVVVIVTYHEPHIKFLQKALDSVLSQTYRNLQVFDVFDDGSFGQPALTRNAGIGRAYAADLIVCLDADDWIEPTFVEECVSALRQHPEASIAFTETQCFGTSDEIWRPRFDYGQLLQANQFSYCSMYKREVWEAVGGYAANVKGCEDWDFWVKAAGFGYSAVGVDKPLFHYRRNAEGLFEQEVVPNFDEKFRRVILNNRELYPPAMVQQAEAGLRVERQVS
jgi:pyruvate-formate lyase-activating enzyme